MKLHDNTARFTLELKYVFVAFALFIGEKENDVDSVFKMNTSQFSVLLNLDLSTFKCETEKGRRGTKCYMENLRVPTYRNSRVIFRTELTEVEREGALSRSEYGLILGFLNTVMRLAMR